MKIMLEYILGFLFIWVGKVIFSEFFRVGISVGVWGIYILSIYVILVGFIRIFV